MRTRSSYLATPGPNDEPQREEENTPDLPQRPHKHEVEAGRASLMAMAVLATGMLFAQTTPTTPTTPQTPAQSPKTMPHSGTQQPTTQSTKGWTMFNEDVGNRLQLDPDQMQKLQDVDRRYQDQYTALGKTPWTNDGYAPLTQKRNTDVKSILTPEQYKQYNTTYGGQSPDKAPSKPAGMTGTTTPPTPKE